MENCNVIVKESLTHLTYAVYKNIIVHILASIYLLFQGYMLKQLCFTMSYVH